MNKFAEANLFTDASLIDDPYSYYAFLREQSGAVKLPHENVVAVVGYDEVLAVMRDDENFSAINAVNGPFPGLPFTPEGDDISTQIEKHRSSMPFAGLIVTQDPPAHANIRALLMGLITPKRLKDNEDFMWRLADRQIDKIIHQSTINVPKDYGQPFTTLVIADLLGVPESDHAKFARLLSVQAGLPGMLASEARTVHNPLEDIGKIILGYVVRRRLMNSPVGKMWTGFTGLFGGGVQPARRDLLTDLALTKYSDGSTPALVDVVGVATFLFAAGQDTTTHLINATLRYLAEDQELQARLRADRSLIPNFIEEVLRLEGTVKSIFRLAKKRVKIGDLDVAPGTTIMAIIASANRDPKRFDPPNAVVLDRKNARENLGFSRGVHACPGAPLARAETRITLERLFDRTSSIKIDEAFHGPKGARRYEFMPTYVFRGVKALHLAITPAA